MIKTLCRADGGIRWSLRTVRGSGPAQSECSESVGFCYFSPFEDALGRRKFFFFFSSSGEWRFWYIALCGSFSSLETAFTFLYGSCALSAGLIQTSRKEACTFPMCLLEVCIYTHGWGASPNDCSEVPGCDKVWSDGRFLTGAGQASVIILIHDPWDCDHQGSLLFLLPCLGSHTKKYLGR